MSNKKLVIGGTEIPLGTTKKIEIDLPKMYNTPVKLPVKVIRGKNNGPIVFISAAIYGDELNGIEIIRRFRKLSILKHLRGTLILVPIVNVHGIITLSRYLPDRRDLNRSFPEISKGSLASRVAHTFFSEIVEECDLGIDLHTGAIHRSNLPQIRTSIENPYTLNIAKAFGAPLVLHSAIRDGSLRAVAQEKGIPVIVYKAGEVLRFDEKSIHIGIHGIVNVLREIEMLPKISHKKSSKIPVIAKSSRWIRASESGMLRTLKSLGDTVKKGEVVAYIDEPLDDISFEIKAPFDGIIIGKTKISLVQAGDAVFHIAKFADLEKAQKKIKYFSEEVTMENEFHKINEDEIIE